MTSALTTGVFFSWQATATGGTPPYTWSATGLPTGLSINSSTGLISGTPTAAGTFNATITVQDSTTATANDTASFTVQAAPVASPHYAFVEKAAALVRQWGALIAAVPTTETMAGLTRQWAFIADPDEALLNASAAAATSSVDAIRRTVDVSASAAAGTSSVDALRQETLEVVASAAAATAAVDVGDKVRIASAAAAATSSVEVSSNPLQQINDAVSSFGYNDVASIVSAIENLGYDVIMTPTHDAMAEDMSAVQATIAALGRFRSDIFDADVAMEVADGISADIDGHPWIGFCGFEGTTFYGTAAMGYTEYGAGTFLKNLWSPNQYRDLQVKVLNEDGTEVTSTNNLTRTIFSDGQSPNSNGYNGLAGFSADDGTFGFCIGRDVNGNGGPYLDDSTSDAYGCENKNSNDNTANVFYWGQAVISTTYAFYAFIKRV